MQAIQTKYLSPTNTKGARIKATCARGTVIIPWDHALNTDKNHRLAAKQLCAKFYNEDADRHGILLNASPWARHFSSGQLKNGSWVHAFVD